VDRVDIGIGYMVCYRGGVCFVVLVYIIYLVIAYMFIPAFSASGSERNKQSVRVFYLFLNTSINVRLCNFLKN